MTIFLEISTWAGISLGAEHFYGKLRNSSFDKTVELLRKLTTVECIHLNKKDNYLGLRYREGELTERFESPDLIRTLAINTWKEHYPDGEILVEGSCIADPVRILIGPNNIKKRGNELFELAESINWYDDEETMIKISNEWEELFN